MEPEKENPGDRGALQKAMETLAEGGIRCNPVVGDKLTVALNFPRFTPFDEQALWIARDHHFGRLSFVLMFTFFLWEDEEGTRPEEYQRRAELVDLKLIPDVRDFLGEIPETLGLSLDVEFDEAVDIELTGEFDPEWWETVVDLIRALCDRCSAWNGTVHREPGWVWAKRCHSGSAGSGGP